MRIAGILEKSVGTSLAHGIKLSSPPFEIPLTSRRIICVMSLSLQKGPVTIDGEKHLVRVLHRCPYRGSISATPNYANICSRQPGVATLWEVPTTLASAHTYST